METRQLEVIVKANTTQFNNSMGSLNNNLESTTSKFSNFSSNIKTAMLPVGIATAAIVGFGISAVKAFSESESINKQLNTVLQSTGEIAGVTSAKAVELSKSLEHMSGVSDETALNAENVLLTFTNIGNKIFPQATTAALDMATALNHGMLPSMGDVQAKAILIGKALQDPDAGLGALKRVGVNVDELKKKFTEGMSVQDKQKLILQELQTEFGGSAKAAGETFAGSLAKLKESFNDTMEIIGKSISDVIQPLVKHFASVGIAIGKWIEANPKIVKAITILAGVIAIAGIAFVALGTAVFVFETVASPVIAIVLAVIAAVALLAIGVNWLVGKLGGWSELFKEISNVYNTYLKPSIEHLIGIFNSQLLPALKNLWEIGRAHV